MKQSKLRISIVSPGTVIYMILFIGTISLLGAGICLFCHEQQAGNGTQDNRTEVPAVGQEEPSEPCNAENPEQIQYNIAKNIIRLHVIANSDTEADQRLKLMVRDEIITSLQNAMRAADSVEQAQEILMTHKSEIEDTANRLLAEQNSSYTAEVTLCQRYFPVKQYGDLSFPAGTYRALCVEIGKAEGRNWWCVLFPSLCFVNETTATVPDDSKDKLKEHLSEEEYQYISGNNEGGGTALSESPCPSAKADDGTLDTNDRPEFCFGIFNWFR